MWIKTRRKSFYTRLCSSGRIRVELHAVPLGGEKDSGGIKLQRDVQWPDRKLKLQALIYKTDAKTASAPSNEKRSQGAYATKFYSFLVYFLVMLICSVAFLLLAPPPGSCRAHSLYILMMSLLGFRDQKDRTTFTKRTFYHFWAAILWVATRDTLLWCIQGSKIKTKQWFFRK